MLTPMKYYYYLDPEQKQQGPVEATQLLSRGCNMYTFVWTAGMADWQQIKDVQELSCLFVNQNTNNICHAEISGNSHRTTTSTIVDNINNCSNINTSTNSLSQAFLHLLYSILWFAGGGLVIWGLIWFFTDSKGGRIKVMAFIAPLYCAWYGLKELGLFFKMLFNNI